MTYTLDHLLTQSSQLNKKNQTNLRLKLDHRGLMEQLLPNTLWFICVMQLLINPASNTILHVFMRELQTTEAPQKP